MTSLDEKRRHSELGYVFACRTLVEHSFATNEKERIRIVQVFTSTPAEAVIEKIEVHKEHKDGPYNGGQVLAGIFAISIICIFRLKNAARGFLEAFPSFWCFLCRS